MEEEEETVTVIRLDQLVRTWDSKTEGDVNLSEVSELSARELLQLQSQVSLKQLFFSFLYPNWKLVSSENLLFNMTWHLLSFFLSPVQYFLFIMCFPPKICFFWSVSRLLSWFFWYLIINPTALLRIVKFRQNRSWRSNNSKLICCLCPPQRFADKEAIKFLHNNKASSFTAL